MLKVMTLPSFQALEGLGSSGFLSNPWSEGSETLLDFSLANFPSLLQSLKGRVVRKFPVNEICLPSLSVNFSVMCINLAFSGYC